MSMKTERCECWLRVDSWLRVDNRACAFCVNETREYHKKLVDEARKDLTKPRPIFETVGKIQVNVESPTFKEWQPLLKNNEVKFNPPAPISDFFLDLGSKKAAPSGQKAAPSGQKKELPKKRKKKNFKPPILNPQEKVLSELVEKKQMSIREYLDTIAPMEDEEEDE